MCAMQKWEYATIVSVKERKDLTVFVPGQGNGSFSGTVPEALNALGNQGWELVTSMLEDDAQSAVFFFKRPKA